MSGTLRRLRRFAGSALVLLAAVFLGRALYEGWSDVREYEWRFNLFYLALSVLLILLYYAQQWGGWRLIMRSFGDPLGRSESAAIWFLSILGRYVPGNVAMVAGRIGMCRRRGIPASTTFASLVYENALILISALLLAALAPVGLLLLHPAVFRRLANGALRRLNRGPLEATLPLGRVLVLLLYYLGGWLLIGLAFAALTASVTTVDPADLPLLVGGYAFAWEVGFLSFITPSGLGVKEFALLAILLLVLPTPVAAAVVVLSRLWQTLAEVATASAVWALSRGKNLWEAR
ncbi:MAG: lysylphosphatidylglycerol synthase domain-containing protein [Actinomycetota bacterium]|nr:lysylphosphatidylglycerol synthase domain-containing protein [Actinomycetota bacterium]